MPVSPTSLINVIRQNKNKKLAATKIIETNPKVIPILPKLIQNREAIADIEKSKVNVNKSLFLQIYRSLNTQKQNNDYIIKLFPDIELAIQILISSILSPKKMTDTELIYKFSDTLNIPPTISAKILSTLSTYLNENYALEEKLPDIIRESLFLSGAYILAIIPESSVDELINTDLIPSFSTEHFKEEVDKFLYRYTKPINIIDQRNTISLESIKTLEDFATFLTTPNYLKITDNPNITQVSNLQSALRKRIIKTNLQKNTAISQETLDKLSYIDIFREKSSKVEANDVEFVKTKKETLRKSIGKPLLLKLPTESTIPVFIPGDPSNHIGYFVILDSTGKPLELDLNDYDEHYLYKFFDTSENTQFNITKKAYRNLSQDITKDIDVRQLFDIYKNVVEKQLYNSIKNSLYGSDIEVANKNDIYFLMFTRALKEQKTSLLFIPKELVSYFTFYYNDLGVGKTLLENISILSSLRAILLFSKVMAYIKQSIDVTKVNISLDPNDPDPEKTIEQVQEATLKLRQNFFPLGINNPVDLVDWIQRAGLQFSYENNPLLPEVKIDFENVNLQHTVPQSELEEELRKQMIIAIGLSPETVDNGFSPEFATTVVNNNILLSKRVMIYQKKLLTELSRFISIVVYNDEELRLILKKILYENIEELKPHFSEAQKAYFEKDKESFIDNYLDYLADKLDVQLPKPDNTNIENLSAEFDLYKENLEKVIDSVISTEIFSDEIAGSLASNIDNIKNIFKHHLLRQWMAENNYYPEVLEFINDDDESREKMIELLKDHLLGIMRNTDHFLLTMRKFKKAINADLNEEEDSSISTSPSSSEEGGESSNEFDFKF